MGGQPLSALCCSTSRDKRHSYFESALALDSPDSNPCLTFKVPRPTKQHLIQAALQYNRLAGPLTYKSFFKQTVMQAWEHKEHDMLPLDSTKASASPDRQACALERHLDKAPHGGRLARRDNVVVGLVLLQHQPPTHAGATLLSRLLATPANEKSGAAANLGSQISVCFAEHYGIYTRISCALRLSRLFKVQCVEVSSGQGRTCTGRSRVRGPSRAWRQCCPGTGSPACLA